jgi:PAS domain S-box-containing protein
MLVRKLIWTALITTLGLTAALISQWALSVWVIRDIAHFDPMTTTAISLLVGGTSTWFLVSQRFDILKVKEELSATIAEKDAAASAADEALNQLTDSEALYRLLADNQNDVISLWGPEGRRLYSSPSAERAFGYSVEEMMTLPKSANAHPDDLPALREALGNLKAGDPALALEYRLVHKDGTAVWVEATFTRLPEGGPATLLSTTRVISERKRLQQELVAALDEAKDALAVKGDFLANMTHELRTPLNAIIGFSGLLKDSETLQEKDKRRVELIHDASQTLLGVVNDVLDFSKLEAGAVEPDVHPFDPADLARSCADLLSGQAKTKGLTLKVTTHGEAGLLLGDGPRLRQVLLNFLSHAVKFTASGEITVQVSQAGGDDRRRLRMSVADQGIGVPPDQVESIFGRFTQGDASVSRRYGGTGLGLAICKRIIDQLGGRIGVDSTVGEGSCFWFEVAMPVAVRAEAGQAIAAGAIERPMRVLVVDDNSVNRELVCALLGPFDVAVETAADGVAAIEMAAHQVYDAILMDVQMPIMDGLTATRRIRAQEPAGTRIPIIAMTANVLDDQVARCLEAGMDDHLGKPIHPAKLLEMLSKWSDADARNETAVAAAG